MFLRLIARYDGGFMYSKSVRMIYAKAYNIQIGHGSYGGCFDMNNIPANTEFGNYCSIGKNLQVYRANHPIDEFTLHPLLYNPVAGYVKKYMLEKPKLIVEHDVWIGANVIILPNVRRIGMGAIIGAGSVVTKDVEEFSVVAGNPAKMIRMRFSEEQKRKIKATKWWTLSRDNLIPKIEQIKKAAQGE